MNTIETGPSNNARDSEVWSRSWTHFRVDRRSARYCHVTFDHPPINTITATTVAELSDLAGLIEQDPDLNVVVFDSANRDFYLAHYDLENDPGRTEALGVGPTGLPAWIDVLVRLARAPVVSIASIRGRARGAGIDRRVSRSRRGNELEIGKALNDVAGQRGPLAHDTNDIKRQQPLNHGVRIGEVVLRYGDVRSIAEHRPIGALKRHILVIVQNSDLVLLHWHPSRGDCFEPSRPAT